MHKYPVLSGISAFTRFVGWIALCKAGLMCIVGLIQIAQSLSTTAQNPYKSNPLELYGRISLLIGGISLLIFSLILIIVGEVIKVFVDIEHNTSQTVKAIQSLSQVAMPSEKEHFQRPPTEIPPASPPPSGSTLRDEPDASIPIEMREIVQQAKNQGYEVNVT